MTFLEYLALVPRLNEPTSDGMPRVKINLVTNFTDDVLKKVLTGVCLHHGVRPDIVAMPYQQYHVQFKNPDNELIAHEPDVTFLFFAATPFKDSELRSREHFEELLRDIERYAEKVTGTVSLTSIPVSYQGAHGNLFRENPFFKLIQEYNEKLHALADKLPNAIWIHTNRIVHRLGESQTFDLRALYAFDLPFTHDFMTALAEEWFAHVRTLRGGSKKAIVLDLDNTLWGGIVGELGPLGVALGPDYPGNAFVNFQKALLEFYDRGIILAIASKNNPEDVTELFEKNPHMILKEKHFSAIRTNWDPKSANILSIAEELNIGTDSMVFLDDNPVERFEVKNRLPEVTVPDFSLPSEEYARTLYAMDWFHQLSLTNEDRRKGMMYAEEQQRKSVQSTTKDMEAYIAELKIEITVRVNAADLMPRLAQLTRKTNQCNLTTKRYAEHDIQAMITAGALAFSGEVSDRFGGYGTVVLAIVVPDTDNRTAALDTFLMSCRTMGRGVECAFIDHVIRALAKRGITKLSATFLPTQKNKPAESFLPDHGFITVSDGEGGVHAYELDIAHYADHPCRKVNLAITIKQPEHGHS